MKCTELWNKRSSLSHKPLVEEEMCNIVTTLPIKRWSSCLNAQSRQTKWVVQQTRVNGDVFSDLRKRNRCHDASTRLVVPPLPLSTAASNPFSFKDTFDLNLSYTAPAEITSECNPWFIKLQAFINHLSSSWMQQGPIGTSMVYIPNTPGTYGLWGTSILPLNALALPDSFQK